MFVNIYFLTPDAIETALCSSFMYFTLSVMIYLLFGSLVFYAALYIFKSAHTVNPPLHKHKVREAAVIAGVVACETRGVSCSLWNRAVDNVDTVKFCGWVNLGPRVYILITVLSFCICSAAMVSRRYAHDSDRQGFNNEPLHGLFPPSSSSSSSSFNLNLVSSHQTLISTAAAANIRLQTTVAYSQWTSNLPTDFLFLPFLNQIWPSARLVAV